MSKPKLDPDKIAKALGATLVTKDNWVEYCDHANEKPDICQCKLHCGCKKWGNCV